MTRNPRPLLALVLLLMAVFMTHAHSCGLAGYWLSRAALTLFGAFGSQLFVVALVLGGVAVGTPKWLLVGAGRTVSVIFRHKGRRRTPRKPAPTMDRLDEVRGALKSLGYKAHEVEPVVAGMDPALPLEKLVRSGIVALRRPEVS